MENKDRKTTPQKTNNERTQASSHEQLQNEYPHGETLLNLEELTEAANAGWPDAQYELAERTLMGIGIAPSRDDALTLFLQAAEQDHILAQGFAGLLLAMNGEPAEARRWFERAAERGEPRSLFELGMQKLNGEGGEVDIPGGVKCLERSAELGYNKAISVVGTMHISGRHVRKDIQRGCEMVKKAAYGGDVFAMRVHGANHARGIGSPRDPEAAAAWFMCAIKLGDSEAPGMLEVLKRTLSPEELSRARILASEISCALRSILAGGVQFAREELGDLESASIRD